MRNDGGRCVARDPVRSHDGAGPMSVAVRAPAPITEALVREPLRHALAERVAQKLPLGETRAAAVLIPMFQRHGEVHLWLARRPTSMRSHAGQVAFPGGKPEDGDASLLHT